MCCPKRYVMITLTSIGMLVAHAMRVNMAVMVVTILDVMPHSKVGTDQARESVSVFFPVTKLHDIFLTLKLCWNSYTQGPMVTPVVLDLNERLI